MEIVGYKCFNRGLINRYGNKFSKGKIYIATGNIKFRNNGFHMCKNMEDTFRYFDALNNEVDVCLVKGSGEIQEFSDEYYGYYDMYSVQKIEILKQLSHLEIIEKGLSLNEIKVQRFLSTFKLNKNEIELFKEKFNKYKTVLNMIAYYQEGNTKVYQKI